MGTDMQLEPVLCCAVAVLLVRPPTADAQTVRIKPRAILDRIDYSYTKWSAAFTRDSKRLASGGQPYSLKLWDVLRTANTSWLRCGIVAQPHGCPFADERRGNERHHR